ncbi:MAG: DNA methyltransferase [Bacteroidota bacterium]
MRYLIKTQSPFSPAPATLGGQKPHVDTIQIQNHPIPRYVGEFWTSKQRQSSSLHEISYRACFKAQLPAFFMNLLTNEGDTVYDPFSGRGTTIIEAALLGRKSVSNDINPLSRTLCEPRLHPPTLKDIRSRLDSIQISGEARADIDLSMFYHTKTEAEIVSLRKYLSMREQNGDEDHLDRWIRMVATNRLSGHSKGFFSVYTLPPNQAITAERQKQINKRLRQKPEYRDTREIILRKSRSLMRNLTEAQFTNLQKARSEAKFLSTDARSTKSITDQSIALTVTSPPFLNIVDYQGDNWLRCWFNSIDVDRISKKMTMAPTVDKWTRVMEAVFRELFRVTASGGWVAFEVGELRNGRVRLDELVVPLGISAGFQCAGILINSQRFTKTSNIWGVSNNSSGTNTNRIVLFHKNGRQYS